ncbi:receptor-like serine/threonine-protein kinase SD1-8 [Zingiber officinale]|uniref:receptor-like serine/threonine-protein kinase SD1-8 n=1 Tax=Zingiber officinale TaxID=94328 RepID=UPI001C4D8942|nr:receptor-like serine/threonine-protein kinase SD1-8 [Zingiber officinale]
MGRRISSSSSSALLLFLLIFSWPACSVSSGADTLSPDRPILDDGVTALVSSRGSFRLGFFSPNGATNRYVGIWYNNISIQTVVWVANRRKPITARSGNLSLTRNGTLILTGEDTSTLSWSSESPASALRNPVARLLDDGNFVVQEVDSNGNDPNSFAWQSFDLPTDTQLPGMALGQKQLRTGAILNINLTAWMSSTDPAPGPYAFGLDVRGDPQIFIWSDTRPYWRGGPWNGRWFSGVPEVKDGTDGVINFNVENDQINYLPIHQSSTIVRWTMASSGQLQLLVWIEAEQRWSLSWYIPKDHCDYMSPCGPNSYCSSNISPPCTCLPAFHPRNQRNWDMLDGSDGCMRRTPLDCLNNTDGFFTQSGTKLPDTSRSTVHANLNLEECKALCWGNCSCTAYAALDVTTGSGCIIWTEDLTDLTVYQSGLGQDLYVRLAAADLALASEALHHHSNRNIIMTVVLPLAILFLACVAYSIWWWKKRSSQLHYEAEEKDMDLPLFDLNTIKDATDDFSVDNKLGEGGFGPVYKGKLGEDQEIAVKRLSKTSTQGVDEFKNEITLIAKLQHRNLVKLLGCCIQGGERLLIYEYMSNGSLDTFLFDEVQTVLLDWRARYNIILGVARGLLYLHHDSRLRIIHRDLKASNILLDNDMNPKISDFGMARIFGGDESESTTKRVVGTYGYMSPEYVMDGIFSIKSDVFSFGVLVLEIISGKKNRDAGQSMSQLNLLGNMWIMWKEGKCLDLIDTKFSHSFSENEVLRCVKVGLLCVQEQPGDRPTMSSVLAILVSTDNISLLPEPKQPGFFSTRLSSVNSDYSNTESLSMNQASITAIVGR